MTTLLRGAASALMVLGFFVPLQAKADLQSDITAACSTGGTVNVPTSITLNTTLNFTCPLGHKPLLLKGGPSEITCNTGGNPCIVVGSTDSLEVQGRHNLSVRDLYLTGPGLNTAGSEGIRILPTAEESSFDHIQIDGFAKGMRFVGGSILLYGVHATNITIGARFWGPTVDVAVHLDGRVANAFISNFSLNARSRAILSDGPGDSGAGASFTFGRINTTTIPGVASVYVTSSDTTAHELSLTDIQDWETACPFIEIGTYGRVILSDLAFSGDPWSSGTRPAIKVGANNSSVAWLRMSNVNLTQCSGAGNLIEINSPSAFVAATGSDLIGPVRFNAAAQATFAGNRFLTLSPCLSGTLTNVRSSANIGCPDY